MARICVFRNVFRVLMACSDWLSSYYGRCEASQAERTLVGRVPNACFLNSNGGLRTRRFTWALHSVDVSGRALARHLEQGLNRSAQQRFRLWCEVMESHAHPTRFLCVQVLGCVAFKPRPQLMLPIASRTLRRNNLWSAPFAKQNHVVDK